MSFLDDAVLVNNKTDSSNFLEGAQVVSSPSNDQSSNTVGSQITPLQQSEQKLQKIQQFDENHPVLGAISGMLDKLPLSDSFEQMAQREVDRRKNQGGMSNIERNVDDLKQEAKDTLIRTAKFIPFAVSSIGGQKVAEKLGKLSPKILGNPKVASTIGNLLDQVGINSGAHFIEKMSSEGDPDKAIQAAKDAGVSAGAISLALPFVEGGIGKLAEKISPIVKQSVAHVAEALSSIPADHYEHALNKVIAGEDFFAKKFDKSSFEKIGDKAQQAVNFIRTKAGEATKVERDVLKSIDQKVDVGNIASQLKDLVKEKGFVNPRSGELSTSLMPTDVKKINEISKRLENKDGLYPGELYVLKKKINNFLPKNVFDTQTVSQLSSEGEGVLKKVAESINEKLKEISTPYAEANASYSQISDIAKRLKSKLKDENIAKSLRTLSQKDETTQSLFQELDDLAPKNLKFMDQLKDEKVRESFDKLLPSGGKFGGANLLRYALIGGASKASPVLGALAAVSESPEAHRLGLKYGQKTVSGLNSALKTVGPSLGSKLYTDREKD